MKKRDSALRTWVRKYGIGTCFYMPFFLLFCLFTIIPVFISMFMSLTNYDMLGKGDFVGLENYANLFLYDDNFILALKNTFLIGGVSGVIGYLASFLFAWIINNMKLKKMYTVMFYMPSIAGGMTVIWDYLFSGDRYGLINNALINIGLLNQPIVWNQNTDYIIPINMLIIIWGSMGTGFLVFLAGLQNEDKQLLEAGRIDGIRTELQELWYIILPQMKPQLLFGAINSIVAALGVFPSFGGFPSPNYVAHTLSAHIQDYGFLRFEMGYASAISMVLFILSFVLGQVVIRLLSGHTVKRPKRIGGKRRG
ncbi:MAG: sugar ABC transporter permease [Clostridia bacterium]|nr:sugar ABC transporter permease [Clostridia bacterium]